MASRYRVICFALVLPSLFGFQFHPPTPRVRSSTSSKHQNQANDEQEKIREVSLSRRTILFRGAGFLTMVSTAPPATADPSIVSSVQGPIQDAIAPGHWIGQFLGLNSKSVTWRFENSSPEQVSKAIVNVLNEISEERKQKLCIPNFVISRQDSKNVHVQTWTKNEWLDSLDISFTKQGDGTIARASFYATGFLPTSIPGAPLLNIGLAWIPFASPGPREMLQSFRLRALEGLVTKRLDDSP